MVDQAPPPRTLGPECGAIIGTGVAIAALILTIAGWQGADTRELRQEIRALDDNLSGKIDTLQGNLAGISQRLAIVESRIGAKSVDRQPDVDLAAISH